MTPHRSRALLAAATVGAALVLSGCQVTAPIATDIEYDAAEGFSIDAGTVVARNVLVVSEGDGAPGVMSGQLVNRSSEDVVVQLTPGEGGTPVEIPLAPRGLARLDGMPLGSGDEAGGTQTPIDPVTVDAVDAPAGGLFPVQLQAGGDLAAQDVPVVEPIGYFADLVPGTGPAPDDTGSTTSPGGTSG